MKKMRLSRLNRATSLFLVLAIMTLYSTAALALPDKKSVMGELVVAGKRMDGNNPFVLLNGEQVISGSTVFSSSTIATTEFSSATVELGKLGYVSLTPNSVLNLNFDEKSISATLSAGNVRIFNNKGVLVKIQTPDGVVGNEMSGLEPATTDASAGNTAAGASRQSKVAAYPFVLIGVTIIVAATIAALAVSNGVILDNNNDISVSRVR